jgi:ADP-heptose:LPS heptosyltransferase
MANRLFGDSIQSLPAVASLAAAYPRAELGLLGYAYSRELYSRAARFCRFHQLESGPAGRPPPASPNPGAILKAVRELRREKYDLAFILPGGFAFALIAFLAGIPSRIGSRTDGRRLLLTDCRSNSPDNPNWQNFTRLLECLPVPAPVVFPLPGESDAEKKESRTLSIHLEHSSELQLHGPYAVISVTASEPYKMWPADSFSDLCSRLINHHHLECIMPGLPSERAYVSETAARCGARSIAGQVSLDVLIQLLSRAEIFIGNNSGLAHLAAACGTATLVLSGASNEILTMPWGPRVRMVSVPYPGFNHRRRATTAARRRIRMSHIPVALVMDEIEDLLATTDREAVTHYRAASQDHA